MSFRYQCGHIETEENECVICSLRAQLAAQALELERVRQRLVRPMQEILPEAVAKSMEQWQFRAEKAEAELATIKSQAQTQHDEDGKTIDKLYVELAQAREREAALRETIEYAAQNCECDSFSLNACPKCVRLIAALATSRPEAAKEK